MIRLRACAGILSHCVQVRVQEFMMQYGLPRAAAREQRNTLENGALNPLARTLLNQYRSSASETSEEFPEPSISRNSLRSFCSASFEKLLYCSLTALNGAIQRFVLPVYLRSNERQLPLNESFRRGRQRFPNISPRDLMDHHSMQQLARQASSSADRLYSIGYLGLSNTSSDSSPNVCSEWQSLRSRHAELIPKLVAGECTFPEIVESNIIEKILLQYPFPAIMPPGINSHIQLLQEYVIAKYGSLVSLDSSLEKNFNSGLIESVSETGLKELADEVVSYLIRTELENGIQGLVKKQNGSNE